MYFRCPLSYSNAAVSTAMVHINHQNISARYRVGGGPEGGRNGTFEGKAETELLTQYLVPCTSLLEQICLTYCDFSPTQAIICYSA